MDLALSPDFDAFICYSVVTIIGVVVAVFRVRGLLPRGWYSWLRPEAWLLFAAYSAVPPGLFWLLDRALVINDTSLFAAVLVGFAYQQIIAGGYSGIDAPKNLSGLWSPFLTWTEALSVRVLDSLRHRDASLREFLIRKSTADQEALAGFIGLAQALSANLLTFQANLASVDAAAAGLGERTVRQKKSVLAIDEISVAPDFVQSLRSAGLITSWEYNRNRIGLSGAWTMLGVIAVIAGLVAASNWLIGQPSRFVDYELWRLGKPNATKLDQFRARERLSGYLADASLGRRAAETVAQRLRDPDFPLDRLSVLLHVLLQHRNAQHAVDALPELLVGALRTDSVDCRTRVHAAMILLAQPKVEQARPLPLTLKDWKPSDGDSIEQLERRIVEWRSVFNPPSAGAATKP